MGKKKTESCPADGMTMQPETRDTLKNHNPNEHHNVKKVSLGQNTRR